MGSSQKEVGPPRQTGAIPGIPPAKGIPGILTPIWGIAKHILFLRENEDESE
jgi:hypothetical protein